MSEDGFVMCFVMFLTLLEGIVWIRECFLWKWLKNYDGSKCVFICELDKLS